MLKCFARFSLLVTIFFSSIFGYSAEFNIKRLKLVDEKNGNYLFRGSVPIKDDELVYQELMDAIFEKLGKEGRPIPENPELVVVSFLNRIMEPKEIKIEEKWFAKNGDKGRFYLYPLYGSLSDPCGRILNNEKLMFDDLDKLTKELEDILQQNTPSSTIVYMHCRVGKDRTGEASAAYNMRHKEYSFKKAMEENEEVAGRKLRVLSLNAIRTDALRLINVHGFTTIGEIDCFSPDETNKKYYKEMKKVYKTLGLYLEDFWPFAE